MNSRAHRQVNVVKKHNAFRVFRNPGRFGLFMLFFANKAYLFITFYQLPAMRLGPRKIRKISFSIRFFLQVTRM